MPRVSLEQRRYLSRDCDLHMKELFGTVPNAYRRLGFTDDAMTLAQFREATNQRQVAASIAQAIEDRWNAYQGALTRGDVCPEQGWILSDAA